MITLGNLTVSDEGLAVIAHVVHNETPEAWATRAFNYPKGGEAAVIGKIARHKAGYLAAKDLPGYQTAAERMADRRSAAQASLVKAQADAATRKAADEAALDARITTEVARQLAARI
ncbi:hypothetical protein LCGC14_2077750 [marine sediment metagenome]|uniref:Uncharacterized protein n=1 Tax=marine sediment metagenome TaxID=412755 RepID=A0A0F9F3V3_9ZZZZ